MKQTNSQAKKIQEITGLEPRHFADLVRTAQLIFDPTGGVSGMRLEVDWSYFGISENVVENLKEFGQKYQYASPHIAVDVIWEQLIPETRSWVIENKDNLWKIEEAFPALDED
jgi:cell division ATPase FtsA